MQQLSSHTAVSFCTMSVGLASYRQHHCHSLVWCASGCVVECRTCNQEVTGLNLGQGYFTSKSTQPSIPSGSVNEYQLWLRRQKQVWLIPLADETPGVQVKLCYHLTMRAIPERLRYASCGSAIQIDCLYLFNTCGPCIRLSVLLLEAYCQCKLIL